MSKDNSNPAFPAPEASIARFGEGNADAFMGISIRDYFAAKAMQEGVTVLMDVDEHDADRVMKLIAKASYMMADAMLKERAK